MTSADLQAVTARMDRKFGEAFPREIESSTRSTHRAILEVAFQLAMLNEKLDGLIRHEGED